MGAKLLRMCCFEGDNASIDLSLLALYDLVIISHPRTFVCKNGCIDQGYPHIAALIASLRAANPNVLIGGYVPATADAPDGTECGQKPISGSWDCPGGTCSNTIAWINAWAALGKSRPDFIFFDLANPLYISAATRNNCYSYARYLGFGIIANSLTPDIHGASLHFACEMLVAGDYVMVEGFSIAAGKVMLDETNSALVALAHYRASGIRLAALATEAAGTPIDPDSVNNLNALSFAEAFADDGDAYQYTDSDLAQVLAPAF